MSQGPQPGYSFGDEHGFALSDPILAAIGLTVVCHSYIEHNISTSIMKLAEIDSHLGFLMTSGMSFRALRGALDNLVLARIKHTTPEAKRYREIIARIQKFEDFRNQTAHSLWGTKRDDVTKAFRVRSTRTKAGLRVFPIDVDVSAISKSIKDAQLALNDLMRFVDEITPTQDNS